MQKQQKLTSVTQLKRYYLDLHKHYHSTVNVTPSSTSSSSFFRLTLLSAVIATVLCVLYEYNFVEYAQGVRCVIPNNYFIWEATRPISDCQFCLNVSEAIVLGNVTREEFAPYAYSSKPIVIKGAFLHWPAMKHFDFNFFKELYESIEDSYRSVDEECQFLHFQSNFISLRDVFAMSEERIQHEAGEKAWYVGW